MLKALADHLNRLSERKHRVAAAAGHVLHADDDRGGLVGFNLLRGDQGFNGLQGITQLHVQVETMSRAVKHVFGTGEHARHRGVDRHEGRLDAVAAFQEQHNYF